MMAAITQFLLSTVGKWLLAGGVLVAALAGVYEKGRYDGNAACVARAEAQTKKAVDYVTKLRERIERGSSDVPDDQLLLDDGYRRSE